MIRRLPIISTVIVLAAAATMVLLGVWQLQRAEWKAGLLESYDAASSDAASLADWPKSVGDVESSLYRRSAVTCVRVLGFDAIAGRSSAGAPGWAHIAHCEIDRGGQADVVLGWSVGPDSVKWDGGTAVGIIGPGRKGGARLIADPPLGGLKAIARPDPKDIPNNHLAYAGQWFFFALTALGIYGLALRRKWATQDEI